MKHITLLSLFTAFCTSILAQDIGVERIIYPTAEYSGYEINSTIPFYYVIKNYGERIEEKRIDLTLNAEMSSPVSVSFTTTLEEGGEIVLDPRKQAFYNSGLSEIPGISGLIYVRTPEIGVGDSLGVCVEVFMEGDTNSDNDELCMDIILIEPLDRDLSMEIVSPSSGEEVASWTEMEVEMDISNSGSIDYDNDSLFFQAQLQLSNQQPITFNAVAALSEAIPAGESRTVTTKVEISRNFPETDAVFCFNVLWMAEDYVVQLLETNFQNNDDCVSVSVVKSSLEEDLFDGLEFVQANGQLRIYDLPKNSQLALFNLQGKRVFQQQLLEEGATISTLNFPKGVYLIQMQIAKGELYTEKIYLR